ncbi:hypothetical protein DWF00_09385 [Bosea caraganae]|uniref:Uncharacterized protein n=1 Tax=Bosea caraganae TaxID=2763117 RepID=A0A370LCF3_9HYPH|nr:hypothetical protein DWF00_09385 [Bosea caraganae]RDJ29215.1 hypothetical protein DWE98_01160 [Bosea caraganae]
MRGSASRRALSGGTGLFGLGCCSSGDRSRFSVCGFLRKPQCAQPRGLFRDGLLLGLLVFENA